MLGMRLEATNHHRHGSATQSHTQTTPSRRSRWIHVRTQQGCDDPHIAALPQLPVSTCTGTAARSSCRYEAIYAAVPMVMSQAPAACRGLHGWTAVVRKKCKPSLLISCRVLTTTSPSQQCAPQLAPSRCPCSRAPTATSSPSPPWGRLQSRQPTALRPSPLSPCPAACLAAATS